MGVLSNLEPKEVFHYFEEICNIPHPSYKEEKISNYCVDFAHKHGLEVYQDDLKNIIIIKEATPGYEQIEPIIIQGHLDMVCEKEADYEIDFENDGLELLIEGDYVTAKGTTLGGDDGIAVAYGLAILASDTISHPRLEVIFTVAEEVGMEGATGIDVSMLKGKKLLNIDSEEEGYMLISCAGGCRADCSLPVSWERKTGIAVDVTVTGLIGGHSGVEINKGLGNSNTLLGRVLLEAGQAAEYNLISMEGGAKDNAIPRESKARVLLDSAFVNDFISSVELSNQHISQELSTSDPDVKITVITAGETTEDVLSGDLSKKAVLLITHLPNGIQRMSDNIEGLVESSLNLGVLLLTKENLSLRYSVRSSVKSYKEYLLSKLNALVKYFGGSVLVAGDYPAWEYKKDSKLREDMIDVYKKMYGKEPIIQAIHAGLECGILSSKIEGLDCVSFGPNMAGIHTTEEKLSISSTKRVWEYLLEVLKLK